MSSPKENKMGVMPVKALIISMSLPMMISMLVQALYNIVNSIFVSQVSEAALTGVTLAFPLQTMMIALGSGTGVGINALLSKSLGEKRFDRSDAAANNGILLTLINYVVFAIIAFFVSKPFINSQTSDPVIAEYGTTYLTLVCVFSLGLFCQLTFERLLQSTGRTLQSMISQITGALINIILDPILIFGIGPFPRLEVAGAAIATVIGQCIAATIGIILNIKTNKDIHISFKGIFHPELNIIKRIYIVGVPSILMMSIGSVMTYSFNKILDGFSSTAVAVFGAYFKLQSFFFMPIFGLNNGLIPVLAYNYGARNKQRINEALRFSMILAVIIMGTGTIIFEVFPTLLLRMFDASPQMIEMGDTALRIIAIHFPVAALCIVVGSLFQAFSKSTYSLIVSLGRQLIVLIPAAWLLSLTGVLSNVWWAFPIAEVISFILSMTLFRKIRKEIILPLPDNNNSENTNGNNTNNNQ